MEKLPAELGTLTNLEVLDACRNKLVGVESLKTLHNLVTLKLDQNAIASLKEGMECKRLTRLSTLSASFNQISTLDEKMGRLAGTYPPPHMTCMYSPPHVTREDGWAGSAYLAQPLHVLRMCC